MPGLFGPLRLAILGVVAFAVFYSRIRQFLPRQHPAKHRKVAPYFWLMGISWLVLCWVLWLLSHNARWQ
jgi:hypothetical protein